RIGCRRAPSAPAPSRSMGDTPILRPPPYLSQLNMSLPHTRLEFVSFVNESVVNAPVKGTAWEGRPTRGGDASWVGDHSWDGLPRPSLATATAWEGRPTQARNGNELSEGLSDWRSDPLASLFPEVAGRSRPVVPSLAVVSTPVQGASSFEGSPAQAGSALGS